MAKTPEEWLGVLTRRLDQRRTTVQRLRSYTDGNAPLPEMTAETRESWQMFQRRSRTNWGELIINSVVDRIVPLGITIGGDNESDLARAAQRTWRDNRMDTVIKDFARHGLTFTQSYLTAWQGSGITGNEDDVVISADSPETMVVITNPIQQWRPEAALKVWRNEEEVTDYAVVWLRDQWVEFKRAAQTTIETTVKTPVWLISLAEGRWTRTGREGGLDGIPIVVYNNPGGAGEFEHHTDLIDRINIGVLERLTIMAMQAFRQRAITGGELPEKDEDGNVIDYSKVFAPAPGALWNLPKDLDLWESEQVNVTPLLDASKDDIRQLSAVTKTPFPMLMPDNQNQSAEGAKATDSGYIFRCRDRISEVKIGAEAILVKALALMDKTLGEDDTVDVMFEAAERVTMSEKYNAAKQAKDAGESRKSIQRNVLGYTPDQIAQDTLDQAQERLLAASFAPAPEEAQPAGPAPPEQTTEQTPVPPEQPVQLNQRRRTRAR